jgi:FkbM family methyltransferase
MHIPAPMFSVEERVAMSARCRDCDPVPKVHDAGMVVTDPEGRRIQIMHNGLKVVADGYYGEWMTNLIRLCRGHHEAQEERLFHEVMKHLPADATMIELGGFWSYYSLWFLMNRPDRRSVVIEPEPRHLEIGQTNARLNGLHPQFHAGFAAAEYIPEAPFACEVSGTINLPGYSVAHLMQSAGWTKLNLLHCDIQGAEVDVLSSCREMFKAGMIDWVFVSTHAHQISGDPLTHQRCVAILRESGAIIEAEHDVHESFSGDGLIVARFCPAPDNWMPVELSINRHSKSLFRDLAFDLDEARQAQAAAQAEVASLRDAERCHENLKRSGTLYTLQADGPLGSAGETFLLPNDHVLSPHVRLNAAWDLQNLHGFVAQLNPDKTYTLVDIGANIGLFGIQAANSFPNFARMVFVEPEPDNFRCLSYNLAGRRFNSELYNIALGSNDGQADFYRDQENIGNYSLVPDAMRDRAHDCTSVAVREAGQWLAETLGSADAIAWKSDTQGFDEGIIARTPMYIWEKVDVALVEMWRIEKPDYDREAFLERIESFPHRKLGDHYGITAGEVADFLAASDWHFLDLLMWR